MKRMSEQEQKFAAEHHTLVYRFLHYYHLPVEEYYDVVIMRYLNAVQRYLNRLGLRQYSFTMRSGEKPTLNLTLCWTNRK